MEGYKRLNGIPGDSEDEAENGGNVERERCAGRICGEMSKMNEKRRMISPLRGLFAEFKNPWLGRIWKIKTRENFPGVEKRDTIR